MINTTLNASGSSGQSIYVSDSHAYFGTTGVTTGVQIIDVSMPGTPVNKGYIATNTGPGQIDPSGNDILDIFVDNSTLFASTYSGGLLVADASDPLTPTVLGTLNLSGETWSVAARGQYAYVGSSSAGLYVIDISNPSAPTITNTLGGANLRHIQIDGDTIIGASATELFVISISDPVNPAVLGSLTVPNISAYEIYSTNGYLYGIDKVIKVLNTYDISDPGNITIVHTTSPGTYDYRSIDGFAEKLFIGTGSGTGGEVLTFDISDPAQPSPLTTTTLSNRSYEIHFSEGYVFSANNDGNMEIVEVCP
ncbi:MAG: hypothetical protein H6626_04650 [Pseudobdellovibrionaceae bacterium]|nr:hypothetical protein [Bdellovibrionales bacterium]USN48382.1 MAG: hypothetical protein H6626_04650 [Pseudobdellovibrionaceae bacterium]